VAISPRARKLRTVDGKGNVMFNRPLSTEDLASRISAPLCPGESCRDAFRLFLLALKSEDLSDEMLKAAARRCHRIIDAHETSEAA